MKRVYFLLMAAVVLLNSCLNVPEVDDGQKLHGTAATLARTGKGENVFVTDDSITLHPSQSVTASDSMLGTRYFIDFRILSEIGDERTIELANLQEMRIDSVSYSTPSGINSPVTPSAVWTSGKYLNMLLFVDGADLSGHKFSLVDTGVKGKDSGLNFLLHHKAAPTSTQDRGRACLSFDVQSYLDTLSTDSINMSLTLQIKNLGLQTSTITLRK